MPAPPSPSPAAARWPDYRRVRELLALYQGKDAPRLAGKAPRVAVVGAGLAGLVAARLLTQGGCEVTVFDAAEGCGGRIRTDHGSLAPGVVVELGGEFIDSAHADLIALARCFGCTPLDSAARSEAALHPVLRFGGQRYDEDEVNAAFAPFAARIRRDAAQLSPHIGRLHHSPADLRFDRLSIDDYLDRIGLQGWLRQRICSGYTTLNGLDGAEQSCINLLRQIGTDPAQGFALFGQSDERWKVAEGLDRLIDGLAAGLARPPQLAHRLLKLSRAGSGWALDFGTAGATLRHSADAVVLALPFTLLRQVQAPFSPAKRRAIEQLAYGTNSKLLVGTHSRLWRTQGGSGELYTDGLLQCGWDGSRQRAGSAGVYTCFLGGRTGLEIGRDSVETQAARLCREAEQAWPGFRAALSGSVVRVHWPSEPLALGSYATYGPGQRTTLGGDEARPEDGLYFAGEHCSQRWQGYMQGAAATGRQAALAILRRAGAAPARVRSRLVPP